VARKSFWVVPLFLVGTAALAADTPPAIRLDHEAPSVSTPTPAPPPEAFDPFFDLKKAGHGYESDPALEPLYSLRLPDSYSKPDLDGDLTTYLREAPTRTAALQARVAAIAQPKQLSIDGITCGLGLSFANCEIPKTPCTFKLGIFDPKSQSGAVPTAREEYSFSLLSNRCSF